MPEYSAFEGQLANTVFTITKHLRFTG